MYQELIRELHQEWDYETPYEKEISDGRAEPTYDEILDVLSRLFENNYRDSGLAQDPRKVERFEERIEHVRQFAERCHLKMVAEISDEVVGSISLLGRRLPFVKNKKGEPWVSLCALLNDCDDMGLYLDENQQEIELFYELGMEKPCESIEEQPKAE